MPIQPDISSRPHQLVVERQMRSIPEKIYRAWTEQFDSWFAAPGTLLMKPEIDAPFFFETRFAGERHPHYGRFLKLAPNRVVELTWVTGVPGTRGSETVLTIELTPAQGSTRLKLTHVGFPDAQTRDEHEKAWPLGLAHLDQCLSDAR